MRGRLLGGVAVLGPVAFTVAWIMASALQHGYSPVRDDLSALAAVGAAHPWIEITGELLLGAAMLALVAGLARVLPGREAAVGCCVLLGAGVATVVQAVSQEDCPSQLAACAARTRAGDVSWHQMLHEIGSVIAFLAILGAPPLLACGFRRHPGWRDLAAFSNVASIAGLVLLVVYVATSETGAGGLTQRVFLAAPLVWIIVVAMRLVRPGSSD